ncbi:TPA: heavy-metal-associated domain-containing protein [Campylobacter jejuni]|uniref:Heavy metal transport/detoxification protein n=1 Tax=Campylobacter jejuni TaxID=197 RepID=A0AAX2LZR6_CAMJU|nr:heavy-metal-associated domain-containing protein [Campylobacter jejuni]WPM67926.1 heavy-metal-associated domain-containing protein [Campylobacter sp. CFSAN122748]AHW92191.1 heavy-metal-associated domain-containing protein [Campylobacter jejuni subsp. jejuni R14]AMK28004.1 heavy metal transport/detoxification protein [Campylobacter jejuni]AWB42258.1 heavy-metal-associated domain protein, putative copper metallochaperone CopZ [Campylobacter jejuni]AYA32590.1 copper chaperone [Campylobacter je
MKFKVKNVNCMNCVNLIKNSLEDEFGNVEVDLEQKILSLNLEENQVSNFTKEFQDLGFEIVERL